MRGSGKGGQNDLFNFVQVEVKVGRVQEVVENMKVDSEKRQLGCGIMFYQ